jgi:dCTP diphosphatase
MSLEELKAELRRFAGEREWGPFHTPKNLAMALVAEAAEVVELFQWLTPEESQEAAGAEPLAGRVREELADVLAYLLRLADFGFRIQRNRGFDV